MGKLTNFRKVSQSKKLPRYDDGGMGWTKGIGALGAFGAQTIDAFSPSDAYGVKSNGAALGEGALSGAASGAEMGSAFGPEGTLIGAGAGALIGGVKGIMGNKEAEKAKQLSIAKSNTDQLNAVKASAGARVAANPDSLYGSQNASYYRFGGVMKQTAQAPTRTIKAIPAVQAAPRIMPPITESPNRQMSKLANGGIGAIPGTSSALRFNSSKLFKAPKSVKSQENQLEMGGQTREVHYKATHKSVAQPRKHTAPNQTQNVVPGNPMAPTTSPIPQMSPAGAPQMPPELQQQLMSQSAGAIPTRAMGGQVQPMSSQDVKFNGPSHANGGIKLPNQGVEVEGGETANKGFVFSKKLGYAQQHEAMAKKMGKAEERPEDPINTNTRNLMAKKIEKLKVAQEAHKASMGMPNDLQSKKMSMGGKMKKMDDGGLGYGNQAGFKLNTAPIGNVQKTSILSDLTPNITEDNQPSTLDKIGSVANKALPFLSNYVNANRKLPLPTAPILNTEITPNTVSYNAERNMVVNQTRGADKAARENLNSGAAVAATKAAHLAAQDDALSKANEAENNTNAQIRNSTAAENAQIKAQNVNLQNNYNNELTQRQLKQQDLTSQNIADISQKIQSIQRDENLSKLDSQKALIGYLTNTVDGAGYSAIRPVISKNMKPDDLAALDKEMAKKQQYAAEDRKDSRMFNRVQLLDTYNKLKSAGYFMGSDYNDVIGTQSTKTDSKGNQTTTTKVQ